MFRDGRGNILVEPGYYVDEPTLTSFRYDIFNPETNDTDSVEIDDLTSNPSIVNQPLPWNTDSQGYVYLYFPISRVDQYATEQIVAYPRSAIDTPLKALGAVHTYFMSPMSEAELRSFLHIPPNQSVTYDQMIEEFVEAYSDQVASQGNTVNLRNLDLSGTHFEGFRPIPGQPGQYMIDIGE